MIKWIKALIANWKYKRVIKQKLQKIKDEDPFIYD